MQPAPIMPSLMPLTQASSALFPPHVLFTPDILKAEQNNLFPLTCATFDFTDEYFRGMSEKMEKHPSAGPASD